MKRSKVFKCGLLLRHEKCSNYTLEHVLEQKLHVKRCNLSSNTSPPGEIINLRRHSEV